MEVKKKKINGELWQRLVTDLVRSYAPRSTAASPSLFFLTDAGGVFMKMDLKFKVSLVYRIIRGLEF